jgi:Ca-activated chloride channel family protein
MTELHAPTAPKTLNAPLMILMSDEEVAGYGRDPDASFGALRTERGLLPLIAMEVDARVAGVVATIELTQQFINTTSSAIEATYIFPLPDRAAVHRFRMEVAGRVIDGLIDERGAARLQYDHAIATGRRAAIAEEERPGVFTLRVGNLMPGETATVRLSLVGPLPIDDGEVTFRFPLVVAPRYIPGSTLSGDQAGLGRAMDTDLVPDASRISPPVLLPGSPNPVRLGLRVTMEDGRARKVASSLHAVTEIHEAVQVIEVRPGERLDRDFLLRWRIDETELVSSLVCADDPDGASGTFALTIVPPSTQTIGAKPRDVVLVIDRSGSMGGWKMVAARRAAARLIDTLTSRDRFCALAFDDRIEPLLPEAGLVSATDHHRSCVTSALAQLEARGGTEITRPLVQALAMLRGTDNRERCVVLVTDGQVGDESNVLRQITPGLGDAKVFTLGIDQAVNAAFLRRLAATGGGLCELVESEARLDEVMDKIHRRIGAPIVTNLAFGGLGLEILRETLAPGRLPDVYAGAPVVVLGRYHGNARAGASIEVSGESLGDPWKQVVTLCRPAQASTWLAASWARAHLRDLDDRYATGARELEPEIVRISKQFGVLSRFTAYVAVDQGATVSPGGKLHRVLQPVESPAGWVATRNGGGFESMSYAGGPTLSAGPTFSGGPTFSTDPTSSQGGTFSASASSKLICSKVGDYEEAARSRFDTALTGLGKGVRAISGRFGGARATASLLPPAGSITRRTPGIASPTGTASAPATTPSTAHMRRLVTLATELGALAAGSCDPTVLRQLRLRLTQWVEDVRSVGGERRLTVAVEGLAHRLSVALTGQRHLAAEVRAIADELARLTAGASSTNTGIVPGAPVDPVPSPVRAPFWK